MNTKRGFTLMELMITLAVVAIAHGFGDSGLADEQGLGRAREASQLSHSEEHAQQVKIQSHNLKLRFLEKNVLDSWYQMQEADVHRGAHSGL